jgi:hypothetical protein
MLLATLVMSAGASMAQSGGEGGSPRRSRSLSQRLEQFRRDLLGSPERDPYLDESESELRPSTPPQTRPPQRTASNEAGRARVTQQGGTPTRMQTRQGTAAPASRMVDRSRVPSQNERLAMKPDRYGNPEAEAPVQEATDAHRANEPGITDETRKSQLAPTSARPARRGGAFELPTPRMARSEAAEVDAETLDESSAFGEPQPTAAEPAGATSTGGNVLFSAKNPMLSISATGPRKVLVGREAQFQMTLRNVGEVEANGVVVKINIPPFVEVAAAEPSGGKAVAPTVSERAGTLEWKLDQLSVKGRETLDLKLIPRKNVPLDLSAVWNCTPEAIQAVVEVQEPQVSLSLSGPREIFYGHSKIYKLTIANPGNGDAENVSVNLLPIGNSGDAPASHRIGRLRAGDSKTIDIELTARQAGELEIKAQAFGDGGLRADVAEPVVVRRGQLKIAVAGSKIKYAGTPGQFRVRVANSGDAVTEGVELSAVLPREAQFLTASNGGKFDEATSRVVWQIGAMQPGDDRTFDVRCTLNAPGDNQLHATAQSSDELSASASTVTSVEALADLTLEVHDPRGPVAIGSNAEYKVIVRNRGTKAAEGIDLVTFFSEGLEATQVTGTEHQIGTGQVAVKTIPTLAAGAELVINMICQADRGGNLVFRAELTCRNPGTKLAAEETTHFYGE